MDNQLAAQLLFTHNLATREQLMECWPQLTGDKDIGSLLVSKGYLAQETYRDLLAYMGASKTAATGVAAQPRGRTDARAKAPPESARKPQPTAEDKPSWTPSKSPEQAPSPVSPTPPAGAILDAADIPILDSLIGPTAATAPEPGPASAPTAAGAQAPARGSEGPGRPASPGGKVTAPERVDAHTPWRELLAFARNSGASDLHLSTGNLPLLRRHGSLQPLGNAPLSAADVRRWAEEALGARQLAGFDGRGDQEFVYELEGWGRYRVTLMRQRMGCDITARVIPDHIRSFEETGLPESCRELTQWAQGLVLITGPVGCGKTSTLATLVEMVNRGRRDHIITLENPVEMVFEPMGCRITQREVGRHTESQEAALRAALREDPDIIVIAELRDLETIRLAVSAAETGHLVFGTMNTANASRTVLRLIDSFPPEEQSMVRNMVSESLRGVISQQLVPALDGSGLLAAFEVLLVNSAVANMIRKEELHQLGTAMLTGKSSGMVILDDSLKVLVEKGLLDPREAARRATNPKDFDRYAARGGRSHG